MKNKLYNYAILFILLISTSGISYGQNSEYQYVENFESWPSDWGVFNRNNPGPTNYTWFKSNNTALGKAYNGEYTSYIITGITSEVNEGDNISQWVFTNTFPISNGDVISFYTKSLYGTNGSDRLQVRLAKTPDVYVEGSSSADGNFDELLLEINPTHNDGYPSEWTKYTSTISSLAEGEVVMGRIGFRYYVPNVGCSGCSTSTGTGLPENSIGLDEEEMYYLELGYTTAETFADLSDGASAGSFLLWSAFQYGVSLADLLMNSFDASMVGIDNFVYNPVDIKLKNHTGDYFVHMNNPTTAAADFHKDMCLNNDVLGQNVLKFTIDNKGASFNITSAQITGADASSFKFWLPEAQIATTAPSGAAAQRPTDFYMKFDPATSGSKEAIVVFNTNHPGFPQIKFKITGSTNGSSSPVTLIPYNNIYLNINDGGTYSIPATLSYTDVSQKFINIGASYSECAWNFMEWSLPGGAKTYTTSDIGTSDSFTLQAYDSRYGITSSCQVNVQIIDLDPPVITTPGSTLPEQTYYLNPDSAFFYKRDLIQPTVEFQDNSGNIVAVPHWDSDIIGGHGTYGVTWHFEDAFGNKAFKIFNQTIHVVDNTPPVAIAKNVEIGFGYDKATVYASQVNNGSYDKSSKDLLLGFWVDASEVPAYGVSNDNRLKENISYDCADAGSTKSVKFVVKDLKTNQQSWVTVDVSIAEIGPGICKNTKVYLSGRPTVSITSSEVYLGSGACDPTTFFLSKSTFTCEDVGINYVEVTTVSEASGTNTCVSQVSVLDYPNMDPNIYNSSYGESTINITIEDPLRTYETVTVYRPYELACNDSAEWTYRSTGSTVIEETTVNRYSTGIHFYPGTSFLRIKQVHPTLKDMYGKPLTTEIQKTITIKDTIPLLVSYAYNIPAYIYDNSCSTSVNITCPWDLYFADRDKVVGSYGYELTGATEKLVTDRMIGLERTVDEEINLGITNVKFFGFDIGGNVLDTVNITINVQRANTTPTIECQHYTVPDEFPNPYTFTIKDPIATFCEVDNTVTWDVKILNAYKTYTWFQASGLKDEQTTQASLFGADKAYNGYYYMETVIRQNGQAKGACYTQINLYDRYAPQITCPDTTIVQLDQANCSLNYSVSRPLVVNNPQNKWYFTITGDANYSSPEMSYATASAIVNLEVGEYTLTLFGKDDFNHVSSCSTQIIVQDVIAPDVTCPGNLTLSKALENCETAVGTCGTTYNFTGNYAPNRIEKIAINSSGSIDYSQVPGSITIKDGNNNSEVAGNILVRFRMACDGTMNFAWNYTPNTVNNSYFVNKPFYRVLGQNKKNLTGFVETSAAPSQNGSVSIEVSKGDIVEIGITEANNGVSGASLKLSSFSAPGFTPTIAFPVINESCNYTFTSNIESAYPAGVHSVIYKVVDEHGNTSTCKQTITVHDNNPVSATAQNATFYLNEDGEVTVNAEDLFTSCLPYASSLSQSVFTKDDLGENVITLTAFNTAGDSAKTTSTVTIADTLKPFLKYEVLDFVINPAITDTLTINDLLPIAGDNCSVDTIYTTKSSFDCSELGENAVDFIVVDVSGNRDTIPGWVNVIPDGFSVDNEIGEQKLCSGDTAVFTVSATNVSSYQWQREKANPAWQSWGTNKMLYHPIYNLNLPYSRSKMVLNRYPAASWLKHDFNVMYQVGTTYEVQKVKYYWQDSSYRWEQVFVWPNEAKMFHPYVMAVGDNEPFDMDVSPLGIGLAARSQTGAAIIVLENFGSFITLNGPIGNITNINIGFGYTDLFVATTSTYAGEPNKTNRISMHKYDRANVRWIDIGPDAFTDKVSAIEMAFDGDYFTLPHLAFVSTSGRLSVMKPSGVGATANWDFVGTAEFANASATRNSQIELAFLNKVPYVAYKDTDFGGRVSVKKLVGNQWVYVGTPGFSEVTDDDISLVFQGDMPYISFSKRNATNVNAIENNTFVYRFLNGVWKPLNPAMIAKKTNTNGTQAFSSIEILGEEIFMYTQDSAKGELSTLKLWQNIPGATTDTLVIANVTKAMDGKQVRCLYGTGCADKLTDPGYIFVDSVSEIISVTGDKYMDEAPGILHLSATANYGTVEWFDADGVTSLGTGNSFTTPAMNATQNFYAQAVDGRCKSEPVAVLAEIPFTAHNSYADTICRNEQAIIYIENQQEGHKYDVYTDDAIGNDSLVWSWVSDGWPNYPRIEGLQQTSEFRIKNSNYVADALSLGYSDDYVDFGNIEEGNIKIHGAITVEAWVYKSGYADRHPWLSYSDLNNNNDTALAFVWDNGIFAVNKGDSLYTLAFPSLPNDAWTHIATTVSSSLMKIYYNGALVASSGISNEMINSPSNPRLIVGRDGRYPLNYHWTNSNLGFDNIRVWRDELEPFEIAQRMNTCHTQWSFPELWEHNLLLDCNFNEFVNDTIAVSEKGNNGRWYSNSYDYGKMEGNGICLSTESIMMDTVTVVVKPFNGIGTYTNYFEGCAGSEIVLTPGLVLDSLMWLDSPDRNFAQLLGYGDTLRVQLEPDEEAEYFISSSSECKSQPVYAYATEIPALESITAETLCGTGNYISDVYFDWSGNDGVDDVLYWDAPVGGNLIYGRYENGYWDYPEGGEGEGEGGSPVFIGTILEGSNPEVTGIDTLYAEAKNDYCFAAERIPVVIGMSPEPEIISTTDGNICAPGEVTVSAVGIGGIIEWYDNGRSVLLGTGDSFTTIITESTGFYAYVYSEVCDDWSYEVYAAANINASSAGDTTNIVSCGKYIWNDSSYTVSGIYTQTLTNAAGCDSVATINLTVQDVYRSDTTIFGCGNIEWRGKIYNSSGIYRDTLASISYCDSILTLVYVNSPVKIDTSAVACSSFNWYGSSYAESGTYTHTSTSETGCESLITLDLTINEPTSADSSAVACERFTWYGMDYTTSGTYSHTLQMQSGCDSVLTLNLTVLNITFGDTTATSYGEFAWYGAEYELNGNYTHTLENAVGCDSILTLHLTVHPNFDATLADLKLGSISIAGFNPDTVSYHEILPYQSTMVPPITAIPADDDALVVVNNALTLPGTATISVTAQDGTTQMVYSVYFTVREGTEADGINTWGNPAGWDNGVPDSTTTVIIAGGITTITSDAVCYNLIINEGATLVLNPGVALTLGENVRIMGEITNNGVITGASAKSSEQTLTLGSDAFGTASYIGNSPDIDVVVERYLPSKDRYWYVSVPISNATGNDFNALNPLDKLYEYNTENSAWAQITADNPLSVGKGFATKQDIDGETLRFEGSLNSGEQVINLVNAGNRWNLVGNPYPSAIDMENLAETDWGNIRQTYYIKSGGNFKTYNVVSAMGTNGGSRYIPSMQAFWIKATGESPTLKLNDEDRQHNSVDFSKSNPETRLIRLTVSRDGFVDETVIGFNGNATKDDIWNTEKKFADNAAYPQLFTLTDAGDKLAIRFFAGFDEIFATPVYFTTRNYGWHSILASEFETLGNVNVILEDVAENKMIDLHQTPVYNFFSDISVEIPRFVLHISPVITSADENDPLQLDVYSFNKSIYVAAQGLTNDAIATVYDISGNAMVNQNIVNNMLNKMDINKTTGIYMVKIISGNRVWSKKVFIK